MSESKIFCFQTGGLFIDEHMADLLFFTAVYMIRDKDQRRSVQGDNFEGEVSTVFEPADLGGITGYKFEAKLETNVGKRTVWYIVRANDYAGLENSVWFTLWHSNDSFPTSAPN